MSTSTGSSNTNLMTRLLSQLITESRLGNSTICPKYDSQDNINTWLQQYELQCRRLSLSDDQKLMLFISQYLPAEISNWVARSPRAATWSSLKSALLETFLVFRLNVINKLLANALKLSAKESFRLVASPWSSRLIF